ncbi:NUDIX domain-containing protein [Deinococcus planocerae]|uniref:NUDIX domain-containing protein n=1 Tax=Deinococcus planocerae TaxID=1737569 RepID=UPI000C7F74E6
MGHGSGRGIPGPYADAVAHPPQLHLLARAVIEHEGHVLLARARGHSNTFLPGGHVEPAEGLRACLARELHEETGLIFQVGAFVGVVEHRWTDRTGRLHHEVNHVFVASSPELVRWEAVPAVESHLTFEWVAVTQLEVRQLMPPPLRSWLAQG